MIVNIICLGTLLVRKAPFLDELDEVGVKGVFNRDPFSLVEVLVMSFENIRVESIRQ